MTNPLLAPRTQPYGLPSFAAIGEDDFAPAFETALTEARAEVEAIATNPEPATFANTVEALAITGKGLDDVLSVFFTLASVDSTPAREALQRDFSPKLAAYSSDVMLDPRLWARIDAVYQARASAGLTPEQSRVLDLTQRNFRRAGAALDDAARAELKTLNTRLAELSTAFGQNLLADERDWSMPLTEADLDGLPGFVIDGARAAGAEKGLDGPCITLSRSLIVPFLQFSPRRDLREKAYRAWTSRGMMGGETDNRAHAAEQLKLRAARAKLLGYNSFAAYRLEPEMAKTPEAVRDLLMAVWAPAKARADADAATLTQMLEADGLHAPLEPWDWRYYAEKRRKAEHDLDEATLKPFLQLDRMIEAAFDCATRLFNLEFRPLPEVDLHHPDARAWEVTRDGQHMAVFIGDYFARSGKRSGAWCSALRSQQKFTGDIRPHVVNVCNFAKPPEGQPALLSYDDARTLFHEFGHALHQILSDVTYEMISGTSVPRDFVELPSQLYEHWLEVPEVLQRFATHAETGQAMPQEMLKKVLDAATFDMGFQTVEYVASAMVDLDLHAGQPPADPMQAQAETLQRLGMPHAIGMRHATPHFAHIFAGGYSAAYYSYMWSEVMDADAFAAFEEAGDPFDPTTAYALETHVLSTGGSQEPEALYTAFRGRLPGVEALLKGRGLDIAA